MNDKHFDAVVLGTGIPQSLLAASLARAGKSVLHIDEYGIYGGEWRTMDISSARALIKDGQNGCYSHFSEEIYDNEFLSDDHTYQDYALELAPKLLFCQSNAVDLLTSSGIGRYLDFKLIDAVHMLYNDILEKIPMSKEDIFTNKNISLPEKRRLMKVFSSAAASSNNNVGLGDNSNMLEEPQSVKFTAYLDEQGIQGKHREMIISAVAMLDSCDKDISTNEGLHRVRKFFVSIGRFGLAPLLCSLYGGGSEIAQAFCRTALSWSIILGQNNDNSNEESTSYTCQYLVTGPNVSRFLPDHTTSSDVETFTLSRGIIITDSSMCKDIEVGVVIVPSSLDGSTIKVVQMSSTLHVCPKGKYVLYFSTPSQHGDPRQDIMPAMQALLNITGDTSDIEESIRKPRPLIAIFYKQCPRPLSSQHSNLIVTADPFCELDFDGDFDNAVAAWKSNTTLASLPLLDPLPDPEMAVSKAVENATHQRWHDDAPNEFRS